MASPEFVFTEPWDKEPWGDEHGVIGDGLDGVMIITNNGIGRFSDEVYISIVDEFGHAGFVVHKDNIEEVIEALRKVVQ